MKNHAPKSFWLVLLAGLLVIAGCTSMPLPKYAKVNDLVTIPLGGSITVANSNYLKSSDLNITITDSLGQIFPVSVLRLYRLFADPSSRYALVSRDPNGHLSGQVKANEAQWMLQFVMPASNLAGETPEPGIASISVAPVVPGVINTAPKLYNENLSNLTFEILPGTGGTVDSEAYAIQFLLSGSTILVTPDDESLLVNNVGGAVFVFEYNTASFSPDGLPYAVKSSPDQNIQLLTKREEVGGGLTQLTAMVISPSGFFDDATWMPEASYYDGLYIAFSWDHFIFGNQIVNDANWQSHVSLVPAESYYIDLDGNVIPGVTPVLSKVR